MVNGPKSISFVTYVTSIANIAFLIAIIIKVMFLDINVKGLSYFLGSLDFELNGSRTQVGRFRDDLILDAF